MWSYKFFATNYWSRQGRKIHEIKYTRKIQLLQYVGWVGSWVMIVVILWVGSLVGSVCLWVGLGVNYKNGPMDNSDLTNVRMKRKSTADWSWRSTVYCLQKPDAVFPQIQLYTKNKLLRKQKAFSFCRTPDQGLCPCTTLHDPQHPLHCLLTPPNQGGLEKSLT